MLYDKIQERKVNLGDRIYEEYYDKIYLNKN